MKCARGNEVKSISTSAGYYIGTWDNDGPRCRISDYFRTAEEADIAMRLGTSKRTCAENQFSCPDCKMYPLEKPITLSFGSKCVLEGLTTKRRTTESIVDKILDNAKGDSMPLYSKVRYNKSTFCFWVYMRPAKTEIVYDITL